MFDSPLPGPESHIAPSFTLVGELRYWDAQARHLRIFDIDLFLAPDVSPNGVAVGLMILARGHYDATTGLRIVDQLRPWAM